MIKNRLCKTLKMNDDTWYIFWRDWVADNSMWRDQEWASHAPCASDWTGLKAREKRELVKLYITHLTRCDIEAIVNEVEETINDQANN